MMTLSLATSIYVVSFVTSAICATLLMRSYVRTRTRLLLWSGICFIFFALNSLSVILDFVLLPPDIDLGLVRVSTLLIGVAALLYAFIWEAD
ncbi:MAG TPA: DUF5985 family protein [Micropepsaceae bacterium]|nr:DUF5985 family protein [Micropepsaceae bacterium]